MSLDEKQFSATAPASKKHIPVICLALGCAILIAGCFSSKPSVSTPNNKAAEACKVCIANLRLIDVAKQSWAFGNQGTSVATPTAEQVQFYMGRALPVCPNDPAHTFATSYKINQDDTYPECRIGSSFNPPHRLRD